MSLVKQIRLLREKMVHDPLPAESVAAGWALGAFVGCAIPFGFQLVVSVPLAILLRVSKVGATVATFITNPATIFIIYPVQTYLVNRYIFGGSLTFESLMKTHWTWAEVCQLGAEVVASFFLGGFILALICAPLFYFIVKHIVVTHRRRVDKASSRRTDVQDS